MFNKYIRDKYTGELRGEYQKKYIKLKVIEINPVGGSTIVNYEVLETKNIDFVEPGYIYEITRPKVFKDIFDKGYWDGIDIHMVL